ncbi:MAG: hypothetical protein MJ054_00665 [Clostridia bacterium]|nr:hypothetical protein [Clostridia bacterium]
MNSGDLEGIWARILRTVRSEQRFALFGLLARMNDVEFVGQEIKIHVHNDAEKEMLKQQLPSLQVIAGDSAKLVLQDDTVMVHDENRDYIARLKDLFGDKVEIV